MWDTSDVKAVCFRLEPANDAHWTSQGLPRMDVLAGMGLTIDRRELNELLPGFGRQYLAKAKAELAAASGEPDPEPLPQREEDHSTASSRHLVARSERRRAALDHLEAGGFTLRDLEPVRSRLDQRITARNRVARRELS
jgi:hypothetical protein